MSEAPAPRMIEGEPPVEQTALPARPRLRGQKEGTRCRTVWHGICEWCGIAFRTNQPDAKFCSADHKSLNRKLVERRMREAYPILIRMRQRERNPATGKDEYLHKGELSRLTTLSDAWIAADKRRRAEMKAAREAAERKVT